MIRSVKTAGWAVCLTLSLVLTACSGGGGGGGAPAPTGTPSNGGGTPPSGGGAPPAPVVSAQEAYIKASNTNGGDFFGDAIALSADGNTLAVAATNESSGVAGINGDQADNTVAAAGAVYVFVRSGATWVQQAYIKASNPDVGDQFGLSVALSADGNTLVVGAPGESSAAMGIGGDQTDNTTLSAGAVYIFVRSGTTWTQQAYIKASNPQLAAEFGTSVALSGDGDALAAGAPRESGAATGVDGDQANNTAAFAGAVYMFVSAAAGRGRSRPTSRHRIPA